MLQQSLSNGEVQLHGRSHDPFKKFLDKLNSSSSSSGSGIQGEEEKDNTLSEVTSFATQEPSPPSLVSPNRNETSLGEFARNTPLAPLEDELSLGEVKHFQVAGIKSRSSPGEVPPILRASETRNGIDVIRISKWCDKLPSSDNRQTSVIASESQYLMEQFDPSEVIQISSQSSINTRDDNKGLLTTGHINVNDDSTESHMQLSNGTKPHTVEGELHRKVVTINIPNATGFYNKEDSNSSKEHSTNIISEITSSLSSEHF